MDKNHLEHILLMEVRQHLGWKWYEWSAERRLIHPNDQQHISFKQVGGGYDENWSGCIERTFGTVHPSPLTDHDEALKLFSVLNPHERVAFHHEVMRATNKDGYYPWQARNLDLMHAFIAVKNHEWFCNRCNTLAEKNDKECTMKCCCTQSPSPWIKLR